MKVLITGSEGFVGRHFRDRIMAKGCESCQEVDLAHRYAPLDARDFFREDDSYFDLVVHLAAVVGGRQRIERAPLDLAVDLSIDAEMFGWALRTRPGRIVYFSSSAAYPAAYQERGQTFRMKEGYIELSRTMTPDLTYGWAKLTGEVLARHAIDAGLRVHVFRPFSGYGPGQALDYPFPSFIERAARRDDPFEIWGDGTQVRDFIHIDDIVNAVFAAIDVDILGPVNLGTGRGVSFNTLAAMVTEMAGYRPTFKHRLEQPVGVHYRVADATQMLEFYSPQISLEEGICRGLEEMG